MVANAAGEVIEVIYPATGEVIATLHCATPAIVDGVLYVRGEQYLTAIGKAPGGA